MRKSNKAESCEKCRSHHLHEWAEDGWCCGIGKRFSCVKSLSVALFKDYSHKRKVKDVKN